MFMDERKLRLPSASEALTGRRERICVAKLHVVLHTPMDPPWPGMELAMFAMGCFWGAEKKLWQVPGACSTQAGYAGGGGWGRSRGEDRADLPAERRSYGSVPLGADADGVAPHARHRGPPRR